MHLKNGLSAVLRAGSSGRLAFSFFQHDFILIVKLDKSCDSDSVFLKERQYIDNQNKGNIKSQSLQEFAVSPSTSEKGTLVNLCFFNKNHKSIF